MPILTADLGPPEYQGPINGWPVPINCGWGPWGEGCDPGCGAGGDGRSEELGKKPGGIPPPPIPGIKVCRLLVMLSSIIWYYY